MNTSFHKFALFFLLSGVRCAHWGFVDFVLRSRAHIHTQTYSFRYIHTQSCVYKDRKTHTYMHTSIHAYFTYTYINAQISTYFTLTHTHSHTHSLTHTHTHSLSHTHSHTLTHTHSHTHTHTHSLSHTHSHTLTHSHILTHTYSLTHTLRHALDVETYRITMFVVFVLCLIKLLTCGVIRSYNLRVRTCSENHVQYMRLFAYRMFCRVVLAQAETQCFFLRAAKLALRI